jgi:hypothetical protein
MDGSDRIGGSPESYGRFARSIRLAAINRRSVRGDGSPQSIAAARLGLKPQAIQYPPFQGGPTALPQSYG